MERTKTPQKVQKLVENPKPHHKARLYERSEYETSSGELME